MIFRRSLDVLVLHNPLDYRDIYLRPDFQFRCAYCLTHEYYFLDGEAGQIDHHRPLHPFTRQHLSVWTFLICEAFMETYTGAVPVAIFIKAIAGRPMSSMKRVSVSLTPALKTILTIGIRTRMGL